MKRQPKMQPPTKTLPRWNELTAEQRQALIITLAAMMVKQLPEQRRTRQVDDA